jgi:diaminohydroxyphosphoribosylaminopyrimidine deaminase/5-amino-6-(5-phosphoribosylamino)uracil reductase
MGLASPDTNDRTRQALIDAGAQLETVSAEASSSDAFLAASLSRLGALGITSLIVEGGPTLHDAFWRAGLVDRVEVFLTPKTIGPDGVSWIPFGDGDVAALRELSVRPFGEDVAIEGYVHRPD